jgi:hypothetical protein
MLLLQPDYYQFTPLLHISQCPPGKKLLCWGKVFSYLPAEQTLLIEDHSTQTNINLIIKNSESSLLQPNKVVKIYGIMNIRGLEVVKIIDWEISWEAAKKFYDSFR